MRYLFLSLIFLLMPLSIALQTANADQSTGLTQSTLVKSINIQGFVLDDRNQFVNLFKLYRNKRLSQDDINQILQSLQEIYEQAGYQGLVTIDYSLVKTRLIFSVSLTR